MRGARTGRSPIAIALAIGCLMPQLVPTSGAAEQGTSRRLADYFLEFGDMASGRWRDDHAGVAPRVGTLPADGTWDVTDVRYADGMLDMHVTVRPRGWTLPVEAGPAVLVVAVGLGGGFEGDIFQQHVVSIDTIGLPACEDDPCIFESDLQVDLRQLPRLARRIDDFMGTTAGIGLVLVRTFAGGTWLQLLEARDPLEGPADASGLASPTAWHGRSPSVGLFPASTSSGWQHDGHVLRADRPFEYAAIVESTRQSLGDHTSPVPSRAVRVVATFNADCDDEAMPSLETAAGDRVSLGRGGRDLPVQATITLPVGTTWRLGPDGGSGRAIEVGGTDVLVTGTYSCDDDGPIVSDVTVTQLIPPPPARPLPAPSTF